jgi:hypothetical protein
MKIPEEGMTTLALMKFPEEGMTTRDEFFDGR